MIEHKAPADAANLGRLHIYAVVEKIIGRPLEKAEHSALKSVIVKWQKDVKNADRRKCMQCGVPLPHHSPTPPDA